MGGVGGFLFGKPSKQKSSSGNYAWNSINDAFSPALGYTTAGGNAIASLLGISTGGGGSGGGGGGGGKAGSNPSLATGGGGANVTDQTTALDNFANSGGMAFLRDQGNKQITSNQAAKGLLNSGSTLTSLEKYGQGLGSTYLNQYMNNLFDFAKLGLGAGGVMASAGAHSSGEGSGAKNGALPTIISAASMIPGVSDIRLKKNIKKIGKTKDGLDLIEYEFKTGYGLPKGRRTGLIAQQVAVRFPEAFVPNLMGEFHGVDYGKIGRF